MFVDSAAKSTTRCPVKSKDDGPSVTPAENEEKPEDSGQGKAAKDMLCCWFLYGYASTIIVQGRNSFRVGWNDGTAHIHS